MLLPLLAVSACSASSSAEDPLTGAATAETTTAPPVLAPSPPWAPSANEPVPELKTAAARALETLTTYPSGGGTLAAAEQRLVDAGLPVTLVDGADALLTVGASSSGEVVYPQLGGLTATSASVMVVVRINTLAADGESSTVTRTVDVRADLVDGAWRPTSLASTGGEPPSDPPPPSPSVAALLANPAIELPDSARWDLLNGQVDQRVIDILNVLAVDHRARVAVVASGHPVNVFATDRQSNHTAGRAVDIWWIDGTAVADQRGPDSPLLALVERLVDEGVTELGSPFDLDGPGGATFTNTVHQDHLHLGFDGV